ncbi:MAG: methionine--tRNA ligase [Thermoplasmata archaeon]|nr:methionine--tRNA ligase [Thermoplasmata archaeon]MCI4341111.1 methionine--tRNA ligase [Thermoplasmata archaeon]
MARIFIGVAWPYANGPYHLGQLAGALLPADEFGRFHRLRGDEVLMVSGSDMHGTPVSLRAEREGVSPAAIAERFDAINRESNRRLGLSFDCYTSTHTPRHFREAQEFFLVLLRAGFVDRRTADLPYCPKEERFRADRYLRGTCPHCGFERARGDECENCGRALEARELGALRCSVCDTLVVLRPSEQFYLRLDRLTAELDRFLQNKTYWRDNVLRFTENFRKAGLRPTPITRDLDWGIPIPLDGYDGKVFYVWFEAVIGYLSASKEWAETRGEPASWHRFWDPTEPVRPYYFIGKDNIFHHTLFWPAMLLGRGTLALPYDVPANEWLQIGGGKASKSSPAGAGGGEPPSVEIPALLERWSPDVIRFYAALRAPQHHDSEYDSKEVESLANEVLANQWGNLVQRLLVFARERYRGKVPSPPPSWRPENSHVGARIRAAHERIGAEYAAVHLKEALELALAEVRETNRWVQESQPWSAAPEVRDATVYEGLWFLRAASVWLAPVIPHSAERVQRMLGIAEPLGSGSWDTALVPPGPGTGLGEITPLFPRPEVGYSSPAPGRESLGGAAPPAPPVALELRAAQIRSVAEVPGADKLYRLEVDLGPGGLRTVVAGLKPFLRPEQLADRRVVLLANLEPRRIRSIESNGMLLAAEAQGQVHPIRPPSAAPLGAGLAGAGPAVSRISYAQFESAPLLVGEVLEEGTESSRISLGDREIGVSGRWPLRARVVVCLDAAGVGSVVALDPGGPVEVDDAVPAGTRVR